MIRKATVADVPAMAQIINDAAELGLMLPKSLASLYETVRAFHVAVDEPTPPRADVVTSGGHEAHSTLSPNSQPQTPNPTTERIVGVCGLSVVWANFAEVASLAVTPDQRGKGIGRQLVEVCLQEARTLGIPRVMTLTYERAFFERLGFEVLDRQQLPLKVWSECVRCPKNQACDEIAMVKQIAGVPDPQGMPSPPKPIGYEVPVVLTTRGKGGEGK